MSRRVVGPDILQPGRTRRGWGGVEGVAAVVVTAEEEVGCSCVHDLGIAALGGGG